MFVSMETDATPAVAGATDDLLGPIDYLVVEYPAER